MRNARLDKAQARYKIARRNINNLRNVNDTTLMSESKELKSLLMKEELVMDREFWRAAVHGITELDLSN